MDPKNWPEELSKLGVSYVPNPKGEWEVVKARLAPEIKGSSVIQFVTEDATDNLLEKIACFMDWDGSGGAVRLFTEGKMSRDKFGKCEHIMGAELDPKKKNGPYRAYVEDMSKSDLVKGMGRVIPEGKTAPEDTSFQLTFKRKPAGPEKK